MEGQGPHGQARPGPRRRRSAGHPAQVAAARQPRVACCRRGRTAVASDVSAVLGAAASSGCAVSPRAPVAGSRTGSAPARARLDVPLDRELGDRTAKALASLGLQTVGDLLVHYPRRWLSRGDLTPFSELREGEHVTVVATVAASSSRAMRNRRGSVTEIVVSDGVRELRLVFFNQRFRAGQLRPGRVGLFSGRLTRHRGRLQLAQPDLRLLGSDDGDAPAGDALEELADEYAGRLIAVYPAGAKVQSWAIESAVGQVLRTLADEEVPDPVPTTVRERLGLLPRARALHGIHRPPDRAARDSARHSLRFAEAFVLQVGLLRARQRARAVPARRFTATPGGLLARFDDALPFALTAGQREVGEEIAADLAAGSPMQRLLQGEVGSGKTLVALRAMLTVVEAGAQAVLLAPTEVLAAQHYQSLQAVLGPLGRAGALDGDPDGTRVTLLTGSLPTAARRRALLEIASGEAGIVVGTHALLAESVSIAELGLVVVDEQHRFGVEQRDALRQRASGAHVLVMTATPIPRTVAMTVFGDLDTSVLSERPAGRQQVATHVVDLATHPHWLERAWQRLAEEVRAGRQGFVVCPRIGEEPGPAAALTKVVATAGGAAGGAGASGAGAGAGAGAGGGTGTGVDADVGAGETAPDGKESTLAAVVDVLPALRGEPALAGLRIEGLHGGLPSEARDAVTAAMAAGTVDVVVATTVVEVGVDVPNASVMVVLDADRFGVSQLHQLRGRIGRGAHPGVCLLVTRAEPGTPARERLAAVAATTDGFELARVDLAHRREGDVLGAAQSGARSSLKLLRVVEHDEVIRQARTAAADVLAADPELTAHPALAAAVAAALAGGREEYLERG